MKYRRHLLLAVALTGLTGLAAVAQPIRPAPATGPAADLPLEALRTAPDLSSTIEAYARGLAEGRATAGEIRQAFVRRMADLGAPELADAQAADLVAHDAADARIRGIAAYNAAGRGDVRAAVAHLRSALLDRPDDPFLLRTAGQIVAWYDSQALAEQARLSREDLANIEWLRTAGDWSEEFAQSYEDAIDARRLLHAASGAHFNGAATAGASERRASATERSSGDDGSVSSQSGMTYSYYYSYYPYSSYASGYYSRSVHSILTVRDRDFYPPRQGLSHREVLRGTRGSFAGTPQPRPAGSPPRASSAPPRGSSAPPKPNPQRKPPLPRSAPPPPPRFP